ncbi:hypothetical protein [Paracoccus aminophilus]|uniref:Uncharacterized protein n=1 Tax=Paracoccus aminophilus JCM 7686 TaxID=1367847 RepID=S5Z0B6_PARAH|nr:hypothetical protein [Paracoccus aminophilus]AGT10911.1 hypothetical protein JCM7686_pAMI4p220 [Paracoccus aminophilus JCM 7686]
MKILSAAAALLLAGSGAAFAETELDPTCQGVGEITAAVFEARASGVPTAEARKLADQSDDQDLSEMITAIVDAAYALDLSQDAAAAEEQMVNFTAEMILACEQGLDEA